MANGYLLDADGTYRGWIDGNGTVWQANGKFLGDLVGGEYVLNSNRVDAAPANPNASPQAPSHYRPDQTINPHAPPRAGYVDGLDACE